MGNDCDGLLLDLVTTSSPQSTAEAMETIQLLAPLP